MSKSRILAITVIAVAVMLMITSIAKMNTLKKEINLLESRIYNLSADISRTNHLVSSIYTNVEDMLKKEASLITDVNYEIGDLRDDGLAEVHFSFTPKRLTDTLTASVSIGDEVQEFTREGNVFKATIGVDIFSDTSSPMLFIKDGDITETEKINIYLDRLYTRFLPIIDVRLIGGTDHKQKTARVEGELTMSVKPASSQSTVNIISAELITLINGEEIERVPVNELIENGALDFLRKYTAERGDKLEIYVEATDSLGYIHRDLAHIWYVQSGAIAEVMEDGSHIYDKNGNRLD